MRRHSKFGYLELIVGIILILLGIVTFFRPAFALAGIVVTCGILALVMGIGDILLFVRIERYTGFGPVVSLIAGILSVMSGIMLLGYPHAGQLVLVLLFPIWFIAHCISRLSHLHAIRFMAGEGMYYFTLIVNIFGVILGFLMIFSPTFTLLSARYIASLYFLLLGCDSLAMALSKMGR